MERVATWCLILYLHRDAVAEPRPRVTHVQRPVEADHIRARGLHPLEEPPAAVRVPVRIRRT